MHGNATLATLAGTAVAALFALELFLWNTIRDFNRELEGRVVVLERIVLPRPAGRCDLGGCD